MGQRAYMSIPIDKFSVCIETVFPYNIHYVKRIKTTASLGFKVYEFWFHDMKKESSGWVVQKNAKEIDVLYRLNQELKLQLVCFAVNSPNGDHGGNLIDKKGIESFMETLEKLIPFAQQLKAPFLIGFPGYEQPGISREELIERAIHSLQQIDSFIDGSGVLLLMEPLSDLKYKGYLLPTIGDAVSLLRNTGGKNLKILFDFFHIQSMTGNLLESLTDSIDLIGHIHIAGVPGQHEPARGEINYPHVLHKLLDMGYAGRFGIEYYPLMQPKESLRETKRYLEAN